MKYTLVTGYWCDHNEDHKKDFYPIWWNNVKRHTDPVNVFVINHGSKLLPDNKHGNWIDLSHNAGHVHDLIKLPRQDQSRFCGWSLALLNGLMLAAANDTDLLFQEQDCLITDKVVKSLYDACTFKSMVCGQPHFSGSQQIEQSLVLIKKEWLLPFAEQWLNMKETDAEILPEAKWRYILDRNPHHMGYFNFGYGRVRPVPIQDMTAPFFLQKITPEELTILQEIDLT